MKIAIYVDYSNSQFNKDFVMANKLIEMDHNVFLAVNDNQFKHLKSNCNKAVLGYSYSNNYNEKEHLKLEEEFSIDYSIDLIINN